jgi:hypothetical protein
MTKLLWSIIIVLIILLVIMFFVSRGENSVPPPDITSPTPPPAPDPHADLIRVTSPAPNSLVTSPLTITGEARGNWYFEASFPVKLLDANGTEIAAHYAEAQGEWMTTEFVPFSSTLTFTPPSTPTGTLRLEKDNASGLPEFDDHIDIPVRFTDGNI